MRIAISLFLTVLLCAACSSVPEEVPADLLPEEYFQRAQASVVERNDYRSALAYYEAYLERFGDNPQLAVQAQYEIAFIYYKLGELERSQEQFESILELYESDIAEVLPRWPLVLTNRVLEEMSQEAAEATAEE